MFLKNSLPTYYRCKQKSNCFIPQLLLERCIVRHIPLKKTMRNKKIHYKSKSYLSNRKLIFLCEFKMHLNSSFFLLRFGFTMNSFFCLYPKFSKNIIKIQVVVRRVLAIFLFCVKTCWSSTSDRHLILEIAAVITLLHFNF